MANAKNPFQAIVDEVDNDEKPVRAAKKSTVETAEQAMIHRELQQKTLAQVYTNEPRVQVRIAPSYAKYFGNIMRVVINGIAVAIPCNGQSFNIPATFACEVERRMREMDAYELKTRKLANVAGNYEPDIGHLSFF